MTVHELCNDAIRYKELLLVDIIQMLIDKQVLSWTDPNKQVVRERKSA